MKKAIEFYYEFYEGSDKFTSVQSEYTYPEIMRKNDPNIDIAIEKLSSFTPKYSNDYKLETVFEQIIEQANPALKEVLKKIFIVTTPDQKFRAFIRKHEHEIDGKIIFFDLGLSNAIIQYSILLSMHFHLIKKVWDGKSAFAIQKTLLSYAKDLSEHHQEWINLGVFTLKPDLALLYFNLDPSIRDMSTVISADANKFVIGHELGHCLSEHWGNDNKGFGFWTVLFSDILKSPPSHRLELCCDMFSMILIAGGYKNIDCRKPNHFNFELKDALGSQLVLTIFGQHINPYNDHESHPSIDHRYGICVNLLKLFSQPGISEFAYIIMRDFHSLLFRTQKRGLGQTLTNNYRPIWKNLKSYKHLTHKKIQSIVKGLKF